MIYLSGGFRHFHRERANRLSYGKLHNPSGFYKSVWILNSPHLQNPNGHVFSIMLIQENIDFGQFAHAIFCPEIPFHRYSSGAEAMHLDFFSAESD
jgi:hypothetical protein